MSESVRLSCSDCAYADPAVGDDDSVFVRCRRFPPYLIVLNGQPIVAWPQVDSEGWCGEWRETPVTR